MKFLLTAVNAKYIHTNPALYSLKAYAELSKEGGSMSDAKGREADARSRKGCIQIAEFTINNRLDEILGGIYKQSPDAVAFSCYIWNIKEVLSLVRELKKILPGVPLWLGGPEASYKADELLKSYPELTGIMIGEGEETFSELYQYYVKELKVTGEKDGTEEKAGTKEDPGILNNIRGIAFRKGENIIHTEERELTDLSRLPFLYDDLSLFKNKIIYYESSRGCPFRCSYCLSSIDKKVRFRDLSIVKKELKFFLEHKVPQVKFIDRTFNCSRDHAMEIWRFIKDHDNGVTNFHFEIAADLLDDEELDLLATLRPGAVQMEIGVQTANPKTIKEIRRVMDVDKLEEIVKRLHDGRNIHIHLDLIAGLPFEDYHSFRNSFNRVYAMKPEQLQLGFLKVLSGSYMAEKCGDYGLLYTESPPYEVLATKWLSFSDVCRLKQVEEMVELYYNSNQFTHTLPYLERFFEDAFTLFERLSAFYERKGYFVNTPSRMYRYEALLCFAIEETEGEEELLKELLTMDVYSRENAKTRPAFARDLLPYKERINGFYRLEEKRRETKEHLLKNYEGCEPRAMVRMLHMEPCFYDIFGKAPTYRRLQRERFVLFDYQDRNPLTHEGRMILLNDDF